MFLKTSAPVSTLDKGLDPQEWQHQNSGSAACCPQCLHTVSPCKAHASGEPSQVSLERLYQVTFEFPESLALCFRETQDRVGILAKWMPRLLAKGSLPALAAFCILTTCHEPLNLIAVASSSVVCCSQQAIGFRDGQLKVWLKISSRWGPHCHSAAMRSFGGVSG